MTIEQRNAIICASYLEGATQAELAERFSLSRSWIGVVLKNGGLVKKDRPTFTKRRRIVGVLLFEDVKVKLQREAQRENVSVSMFVAELISVELRRRKVL